MYFRESENIAIEMSLNQGRLVQAFAGSYVAWNLRIFNGVPIFYSNNCSRSVLAKNWRLCT